MWYSAVVFWSAALCWNEPWPRSGFVHSWAGSSISVDSRVFPAVMFFYTLMAIRVSGVIPNHP